LKWVHAHAAEYRLDPKRIVLAGESAGAHLAALAAVRADKTTPVAAVVAFYAPSDLAALYTKGAPLSPNQSALFGRTIADDATLELLRAASPITYVRAGLPPFLLLHGTADARVPYAQSTKLQAALRAAGVTCDLITIPEGAHGMTGWAKQVPDFKARVVTWLNQRW
jgi:dipeptidyl aminopeptidase/acylaminoacyl peptidase